MNAGRIEFKAAFTVDEAGVVTGLASVFGTVDRGGDIVRKGAFASARPPLPMLASHDQADVVGVWDELVETDAGLTVKGRLLVGDVARASEVRALIRAGAMTGLSIGYVTRKYAKRVGGGRDLIDLDLAEISVVAVPMHPGARITSVKANAAGKVDMTLEEMQAELAALESKHAGQLTTAVAAAVAPYVQRLDKIEAKTNRADATPGPGEVSIERKAFLDYLRNGATSTEVKALTVGIDPQGGYLAPPELSAEILKDLVITSPLRQYASVRGTSAPSVIYPKRSAFGNATWDGELSTETETTGSPFGSLELSIKGMSTFVEISNQLMQDAPQVETEVRELLAEDFGKKEASAFVKGTGVLDPEGLMTNSEIPYSPGGHASLINTTGLDNIIKMTYELPAMYRAAAAFALNGRTAGLLRVLKDTTGQFLWQTAVVAGQPDRFLGYPVIEMPDMDDVAANAFPIIFGDFSGYRIVDRLAMTMLVDPYSKAVQKKTVIHATRRVGGRVIMPAKFRKLKISTT